MASKHIAMMWRSFVNCWDWLVCIKCLKAMLDCCCCISAELAVEAVTVNVLVYFKGKMFGQKCDAATQISAGTSDGLIPHQTGVQIKQGV